VVANRLKRLLLPAWNGGHRLAWRLGEIAGAIRHRRCGRCSACGRLGLFYYRRRVIGPELARRWGLSPRLAEAVARKESSECSRCGAKLRGRRLATVLLDLDPVDSSPSVAAWARSAGARALRVAEVNKLDGVREALAPLPGFVPCEYRDGARPGEVVDGVRHEDLTALTFADDSVDLLITSETLEHVPDLDRALAEIRRVLAPGGRHVFTVPQLPGTPTTFARARLGADGSKVDLAPPIAHPGGDWGWPVFTEFGADLPDLLRRAGFEVEVRFGPITEDDVAQVYVTRKPGNA
jgi:SAM-dependent methyltransferase